MKKRIISAAMALIMSACMLPTGILTGAAYDEEPAESLEAINDRIKIPPKAFMKHRQQKMRTGNQPPPIL